MKVPDVLDKELEVHAPAIRSLQGSRLPRPIPSSEHELGALQSDIGMSLIAASLDNLEAQALDIKCKRLRKIGADELWDKRIDHKHVVSAIEQRPSVGHAVSTAAGRYDGVLCTRFRYVCCRRLKEPKALEQGVNIIIVSLGKR
jgi:hypothetical protein